MYASGNQETTRSILFFLDIQATEFQIFRIHISKARIHQNCEKPVICSCYFAQGSAPQDLRLTTAFFEEHRAKVSSPHRSVTCVPWSLRWATGVLRHPPASRSGSKNCRRPFLAAKQKETAAKIAALQFFGIKPSRSTAILVVGPVGILPAESGSHAAPPQRRPTS